MQSPVVKQAVLLVAASLWFAGCQSVEPVAPLEVQASFPVKYSGSARPAGDGHHDMQDLRKGTIERNTSDIQGKPTAIIEARLVELSRGDLQQFFGLPGMKASAGGPRATGRTTAPLAGGKRCRGTGCPQGFAERGFQCRSADLESAVLSERFRFAWHGGAAHRRSRDRKWSRMGSACGWQPGRSWVVGQPVAITLNVQLHNLQRPLPVMQVQVPGTNRSGEHAGAHHDRAEPDHRSDRER